MSVLENFKNIPRSPYGGATELKCNFFLLQICNKIPRGKKTKRGPVAPPTGDRTLSPGWATGARRPLGGRQAPLFFSPGTSLQI